jgi:hypothetical protein
MSRRLVGVGASLTLLLSGLVLAASPSAIADAPPPTSAALASALDAPADVAVSVVGDSASYLTADTPFNDFPSRTERLIPQKDPSTGQPRPARHEYDGNDSYVLLSTGKAADVFGANVPNDQPSTDVGDDRQPDVTTLRLDVAASGAPRCLLVDFAMGTEERVHTYTPEMPGDYLSITRDGDDTERAMNARGVSGQQGRLLAHARRQRERPAAQQ